MTRAVDSFSPHTHASVAAMKAQGIVGALRYHYNTSAAEHSLLVNAGCGFGLICEFDTTSWHPPVHAPQLGAQHAAKGIAVAQAIGLAAGSTLWFTVDTAPNGRHPQIKQYFGLAAPPTRAAGFKCGAYAGALIGDELLDAGLADMLWITGASSWNEGHVSTRAVLHQREQGPMGGITVDFNDVLADDWGQSPRPHAIPPPSTGDLMSKIVTVIAAPGSAHEYYLTPSEQDREAGGRGAVWLHVTDQATEGDIKNMGVAVGSDVQLDLTKPGSDGAHIWKRYAAVGGPLAGPATE